MLGKSNRTSDFRQLAEKRLRRVRRLPYTFLVIGLAMTIGGMAQSGGQPDGGCAGQNCETAASGLRAFLDRDLHGLDGNGRACADCHTPLNSFQLSPASAEARYQLLQFRRRSDAKADDPLFRAIDADDFRINGANASDFTTLRKHALIRIAFPLPAAMKLINPQTNQPSDETFVDVWRAVPTVNDVALTGPDGQNPSARGPNPAGGYQYDARFGTLQQQALAALVSHAEIRMAPSQPLLDALAAFQLTLFTNPRVRPMLCARESVPCPIPTHR
jgi:hypothetical protein